MGLNNRQNLARRNSLRAVADRGRCEASGEKVEPTVPLDATDDAKIFPDESTNHAKAPRKRRNTSPKYGACQRL